MPPLPRESFVKPPEPPAPSAQPSEHSDYHSQEVPFPDYPVEPEVLLFTLNFLFMPIIRESNLNHVKSYRKLLHRRRIEQTHHRYRI